MARTDALSEASLADALRRAKRAGEPCGKLAVARGRPEFAAMRILRSEPPAISGGPEIVVDPYMDEDSWELR